MDDIIHRLNNWLDKDSIVARNWGEEGFSIDGDIDLAITEIKRLRQLNRKEVNPMHHNDMAKLLKAGFTLYRCSDTEMLIKCQTDAQPNWRLVSRHKTKNTLHHVRAALYNDPNAIQV